MHVLLFIGCASVEPTPVDPRVEFLGSIEERWIDARFNGDDDTIASLERDLTELDTQDSIELERSRMYWLALVLLTTASNDFESRYEERLLPTIDRAVDILEVQREPNSEELSLLTLAHSLKLQHVAGSDLFRSIQDQRRRVADIKRLYALHPRVLLICALSDLNEPSGFGGGTAAVELLETVVASTEIEPARDDLSPTWGYAEASVRLTEQLIDLKRFDGAERVWLQAVERFAEHPALINFAESHKDFIDTVQSR